MTVDDILTFVQGLLHSSIFVKYGLVGLFVNGVLSSTAIPLPVELTVSALLTAGYDKLPIFVVLTIASTLGSIGGYWLGRSGNKLFQFLKWKVKEKTEKEKQQEDRGSSLLTKYGWIAIVGSAWIPIIGDFIPIVAGTKKYDFRKFVIALSIGKVTKVLAIVYFSSIIIGRLFG